MSQLEQGDPLRAAQIRRPGTGLAPSTGQNRTGFDVVPNAPGLVTKPPTVSSGGRLAAQLGQALGVAGQLANQIDRETAKIDRHNAKIDQLDRANAATDAQNRWVTLQQEIADRKVIVPDSFLPDDPARTVKYASMLMDADVNDPKISEEYRREYTSIAPRVAQALVKQQTDVRDEARMTAVQKFADGAMAKRDPAETEKFVQSAMEVAKIPEIEARKMIQLPIGMAIATDPTLSPQERIDQFTAWQKSMGGWFVAEQQRALVKQQTDVRDEARMTAVQKFADGAMSKRDPAETEKFVQSAMEVAKIPEIEARKMIQLPIGMAIATDPTLSPQERIDQFTAWQKSMNGMFMAEQQRAAGRLSDEVRQAQAETERAQNAYEARLEKDRRKYRDAEEQQVYAALDKRDYASAMRATDKAGYFDDQDRYRFKQTITKQAQSDGISDLRLQINEGLFTPEQVKEIANGRGNLPKDDFNYIDPSDAGTMVNAAKDRTKSLKDEEDVARFLKGDTGVTLWSEQHDKAMTKAIGPDGLGLIDANNNIANAPMLASIVSQAGFVPKDAQAVVFANLRSNDPAKVQAAVQTIGMISRGAPRVAVDMSNAAKAAGPTTAMMYDTAIAQYAAGNTNDAQSLSAAAQNVIAAAQAAPDQRKADPGIVARLAHLTNDKNFIDNKVSSMITELRSMQNGAGGFQYEAAINRGVFGIDWLSRDPAILDTGTGAGEPLHDYASRIYTQEYQRLSAHQPSDVAKANAEKNTMSQLRNSVDFVRWDGKVTPVLVDQPGKMRMPESQRWGPGFEEEAKAAFAETGIKATVAGMAPFFDSSVPGWVYLDENAQPIRRDNGNVIVFHPADETQRANADRRKKLDEQFDKYGTSTRRSTSEIVNDSTVGRYR